jgi:predicted transcriptional regulator
MWRVNNYDIRKNKHTSREKNTTSMRTQDILDTIINVSQATMTRILYRINLNQMLNHI